ncbi:MAG: hypothetical protein IT196_00665 [Acidimicrobiales bacterium]|nr:hypothetical protein [Acidimicrobiales bacterium]
MTWEAKVRGSKAGWGDRRCIVCGEAIVRGQRVGVLMEYVADHPERPGWYPFSGRLHHECASDEAAELNRQHQLLIAAPDEPAAGSAAP